MLSGASHTQYAGGKVCLSILNTWPGPKWSPSYQLQTCMKAICAQVIGVTHPIENEPGVKRGSAREKSYYRCIKFETFRIATLHFLQNCPETFSVFLPLMRAYFVRNIAKYRSRLEHLTLFDPKKTVLDAGIYGFASTIDYPSTKKKIEALYKKLAGSNSFDDDGYKAIMSNVYTDTAAPIPIVPLPPSSSSSSSSSSSLSSTHINSDKKLTEEKKTQKRKQPQPASTPVVVMMSDSDDDIAQTLPPKKKKKKSSPVPADADIVVMSD
jgi:hypothetical protein